MRLTVQPFFCHWQIKCKVFNTSPDLITDEKPQGTQSSLRSGSLLVAGVAIVALGAFLFHKARHITWSSIHQWLNTMVYCTGCCYLLLLCFILIKWLVPLQLSCMWRFTQFISRMLLNPFTPKIWLLILPSSCHTFPCKLVLRTWC